MGIKSISLAATALFLSTSANAALVSVDWQSAGDNLITRDSVSGLDWLDLTETANLSYNYVSGQFGSGGAYEGWRYTTGTEVEDLFVQFGLPIAIIAESPPTPEHLSTITNMVSYLGDTFADYATPGSWYGTLGIIGESVVQDTHVRVGAYTINYDSGAFIETLADGTFSEGDSHSYEYLGHYIVQPTVVPIPAAFWLFGSSLLGLIGVARSKKV